MKTLLTLAVLIFCSYSFADCPLRFDTESLCGEIQWIKGPVLNAKSHFQLKFWKDGDALKTPVSPNGTVKIYSWMTMANGHDHGGPKMTKRKISEGVYEVNDARFFMHGMNGFWEIIVDLTKNEIRTDSAKYLVKF